MKILSINVSEPKKITFNGKELITSIYKIPVNKAVNLTELGLEGDRQADLQVHGGYDKACLLYTSPSPRDRTRSRMPSSA